MSGPAHSLADDFPGQQEAIDILMQMNARFAALVRRTREIDRELAHTERAGHGEEDREKGLKVERLGLLDEIGLILRGGENAPSQARKDGRE